MPWECNDETHLPAFLSLGDRGDSGLPAAESPEANSLPPSLLLSSSVSGYPVSFLHARLPPTEIPTPNISSSSTGIGSAERLAPPPSRALARPLQRAAQIRSGVLPAFAPSPRHEACTPPSAPSFATSRAHPVPFSQSSLSRRGVARPAPNETHHIRFCCFHVASGTWVQDWQSRPSQLVRPRRRTDTRGSHHHHPETDQWHQKKNR